MRFSKKLGVSFIGSIVICSLASAPAEASEPPSSQWAITGAALDWNVGFVPQLAAFAPDATACDGGGLWATESPDAIASIVLGYAIPVIPGAINVYQNYVQGAISIIEVSNDEINWTTVYTGDPSLASSGTCLEENQYDDILSVPVTNVDSPISFVRITVDQTTQGWAEIDAVELVGQHPDVLPATGNSSSSTVVLSLMLILSGAFVVMSLRRRIS